MLPTVMVGLWVTGALAASGIELPGPCEAAMVRSEVRASRCSCVPPPPPGTAQARATAVFLGVVDSIVGGRAAFHGGESKFAARRVRFRVHAAWPSGQPDSLAIARGEGAPGELGPALPDSVVWITTGIGGGDCGYQFMAGGAYLVYAVGPTTDLRTGICQRTRPQLSASEDLRALGQPTVDRRPRRTKESR